MIYLISTYVDGFVFKSIYFLGLYNSFFHNLVITLLLLPYN